MNETAIRWVIALAILSIVIPLLLYLVTGTILGLLVPCSPGEGMFAMRYQGDPLVLGCGLVRTTTKIVVSVWVSTVFLFGAFMLGTVDLRQ